MNDNPATDGAPVLLVDDDELYALLVRQAWSRLETNVPLEWLDNGKRAVTYLDGTGPASKPGGKLLPRMILTDLNMPGLNGFELLCWVRRNPSIRNMPVILLSGSGSKQDVEEAYALGANLYVEKPRGLDETMEMLRQLDRFWLAQLTESQLAAFPSTPPRIIH
jgi:CheY-like chemotaxis protein